MKTLLFVVVWAAIAIGGFVLIQNRVVVSNSLRQPVDKLLAAQQEERNALEQELKRAARDAEARRKTDLENAWGGPLAAAFNNPAFTLRDALQQAALGCAPTNTFVRADVDRFTQFTVTFESASPFATNAMIATARKVLPLTQTYLHALRFSERGKLVAEIDRSDIEFIDDWSRAPDQRIAMLLPRESQSRVVQDAVAIERLRDEQRISQALAAEPAMRDKADNANRQFRQTMETAYNDLVGAFESLNKAVALHELRNLRGLDDREKHLRLAVEQADRAHKFWRNPEQEWQRILESEGIAGELRDVLVKSFPAIFRSDRAKSEKLFEALRGQIESGRFILQMLTQNADKWRFSSEGISLRDPQFADRFEDAQRQFREDAQQSDAAIRAWRDAIGPSSTSE
jgi:hypothetical protein